MERVAWPYEARAALLTTEEAVSILRLERYRLWVCRFDFVMHLGDRILELPERSVESPLIIGRGADADVQIPSIHVALQHLALFVHEGRWIARLRRGAAARALTGRRWRGRLC